MCWEQSRRKRTIATSRSEATTTETEPDTQTTARPQESLCPAHPGKKRCPPSATVTEPPRGKRLPLDKLFQERTHRPRYPPPLAVPRNAAQPLVSLYFCHPRRVNAYRRRSAATSRGCEGASPPVR